jgi:type I restriction-modification system DNA methylase subunit
MIEGNCFRKWLNAKTVGKKYFAEYMAEDFEKRIAPITKVMMNPPFALKKGDEKEYKFIEHALKQMEDGGLLFAVLPISVLVESEIKTWRKEILLKNNTLLAVVTFPEDLFNPSANVGTLGLFIKKGTAHNFKKDKVYFARCIEDGFKIKKAIRKESKKVRNMLEEIREELKQFIKGKTFKVDNVPEFKKVCLLDENDKNCELIPESYIDSKIPGLDEIEKGVESLVKSCACYIIRNKEC